MMAVFKEVGLRWVVEALVCGQGITGLPIGYLPGSVVDNMAKLAEIVEKLEKKRPVIVGYNLFVDLIYLCQNFLFDLPLRVGEFAALVRDTWPMVVDTKYMATQWLTVDGLSTLEQVEEELADLTEPVICEWLYRGSAGMLTT
jgi:poly(A)-specific ribonuclease